MDRKWLLIGLVGLVALLCHDDGKVTGQLSEIKRRRSRRLFYISNGKVIPKSEVDSARRMTRSGYGKVFAVWAYNANEAMDYIRQGKAESVSGLGEHKENFTKNEKILIEYFQTSLKDHIRLNPKSKTNEIYNLSSASHYGIDLPKTITRNDLTKLASKIPDALEVGKDFGMPTIIQFNKNILDIKTHVIPEQTSFTERSQMTLFGGLGYKGWDEEGAIRATIKAIDKFQGKPAYVYATYTGIKSTHIKPPSGQPHYRVNPDGSVDKVIHSKGVTTEKTIINPKYKPIESKGQMNLFGLGWTKAIKTDLAPLAEEAKNYSSPDDFANAFYGRGGRMMSQSGEYHSERISRISQIDDEYNPQLSQFVKQYPEQTRNIPGLNKIKGNEKTVTIYRSATGDIRPGDWVALSSTYAKGHSRSKEHKVYSMQVPISDIVWAGTSAEEWFYAPKSAVKEFKDFDPKKFYTDVIKGNLAGIFGNIKPFIYGGSQWCS